MATRLPAPDPKRDRAKSSTRTRLPAPGYTPKKEEGKSVGGFVGNLASGTKDMIVGLGPGLYMAGKATAQDLTDAVVKNDWDFERTREVGGAVVDQYVDTYGPAFKGDFGKTWDKIYADPSGPLTDVITIFSGGAAGAAKAGIVPAKAGTKISVVSRTGKAGEKIAAGSEIRAIGQKATNSALTALPKGLEKVGAKGLATRADAVNDWRVGRIQGGDLRYSAKTLEQRNLPFLKTLSKVTNKDQRVATWAIANLPLRKDFDAYITRLKKVDTDQARATVEILERPAVQKAFDAPTPKMLQVIEEARKLGDEQVKALGIDPATALGRQYMHTQLVRGGRFITDEDAKKYAAIEARMPDQPQVSAQFPSQKLPTEPGVYGAPKAAELRAEIASAGRPEPVYLPDLSSVKGEDALSLARGGGKAEPAKIGAQRQNKGVLFLSGQLIMDPAVLNRTWLKAVKYRHYQDIHDEMIANARTLPKGETLPKGWEYIREKRSDKIRAVDQQKPDFEEWAKAHLNDDAEFMLKDNPFTTRHAADDIARDGDSYLIVPSAYSRAIRGEFTQASRFVRFMNAKPLRVWRALVLGMRPAWLVNNIVGNTLMYVMGSNDIRAITSLGDAIKRMAPKHQWDQFDEILKNNFPVSESGTFVGTQFPTFRPGNKLTRAANAVASFLPKIDRAWDQALRRAMIRTEIKRNPQILARAKAMKGENDSLWKAAAEEFADDPTLVRKIEAQVHDSLGNFENLTPFERTTVRSVIPFWAWYRAITAVTLKLPFDSPVRVNLLGRLGQVGVETYMEKMGLNKDEVPDSMRGFILFGIDPDGRLRGLSTAATNPYGTTIDVSQFVAALSLGAPGDAAKHLVAMNPWYEGLIENIVGKDVQTGRPIPERGGGAFAGTVIGVGDSLPQWRLIQALRGELYTSPDTYTDRDKVDEALRFGGLPYQRISPSRAKEIGPG